MPEMESSINFSNMKEKGNDLFKDGKYSEAISEYMKALTLINGKDDELAVYKNLSAAYLKLGNHDGVIDYATRAINLNPSDVKALYRRCQAYQALGKFNDALKDANTILRIEPKNTAIQSMMRELNIKLQDIHKQASSLNSKVKQMLQVLSEPDSEKEKRIKAANNMIVLARENAGCELMIQLDGLTVILKILKSKSDDLEIKLACIRTLSEFGKNNEERSLMILKVFNTLLVDLMQSSSCEQYINALQYTIQVIFESLSGYCIKDEKPKPDKARCEKNEKNLDEMMAFLVVRSSSHSSTALGRDAVIELLVRHMPWDVLNWGMKLVDMEGLVNFLDVASELEDVKYESSMNITTNTRHHISMALERSYMCMDYDAARDKYREKVMLYINDKLKGEEIENKVRATACITALCLGPIDLGNNCLAQKGIIEMMFVMAGSDDEVQQKVAAEAIIAAATKKDKSMSMAQMGAGILKKLYKSSKDEIKVRALVGLCKLGSIGGTDASIRPFAEGSNSVLATACRKFLVKPQKDKSLRKWAAEGLSYLTLDADIKEELIEDKAAIVALIELAKAGDISTVFGVVTTLVNLTNSYEKQDVAPELKQLAQFAKQHVPEDHPFDDKEHVDRRCTILCEMGVTTALIALSKAESKSSREMMSRVFDAICELQENRGKVVQQGGTKVLLKLALENNTDKGKFAASQALARIGITINPETAFPGQRCVEVVRPLKSLLHPDCSGLENFEGLMALTNLAQVNDCVRNAIIKDNGYSKIENYMFEDHEMLRRAATQCVANLIVNEEVIKLYESENDRVKYLVVLSMDEDLDTARAGSGALAMLTSISKISCGKVFESNSWMECLIQLVSSKDNELQHRGVAIVFNLIDAGEETALKIVETTILEVLMAICRPEVDDISVKVKELAISALKRAEEYKLIKPFETE